MDAGGSCIKVFDPYDWMPGHGENNVQLSTEGFDLLVKVFYDAEADTERFMTFRFKNAFGFYKGSFPGPDIFNVAYRASDEDEVLISCLVEFPNSQISKDWNKYNNYISSIRHYEIAFLSENVILEIFAEDVKIDVDQI